jgi:RNA polymerase sigma-70 factor (ECF subfamily)
MNPVASFPAQPRPDDPKSVWRDEGQLLAAIRDGDRDAAETMVDRTYSAVFASIFRLCGDTDLAADLTQDTYRKAWTALPGFDGRSQLFTWLYRIAYTTFLNYLRQLRKTMSLETADAETMRDTRSGAEELMCDKEEAMRLRNAVMELPDDLRFTVTAVFWGGLPVREVAQIEQITTVAIRKRLHRAFSILEVQIDEEP